MEPQDLSNLRMEYTAGELDVDSAHSSPFVQFADWFKQAQSAELLEPNAMVLSTVSADQRPTQRTVLLKYFDADGFVFFTNYDSRKSKQIKHNHQVSLLFPWYTLQRQVEISGTAELVSRIESLRYFCSRPRDSQIGAWVSQQSTVVNSRSLLMAKWDQLKQKFSSGEIPLPDFWGGYKVRPDRFEFWQGRRSRLHDRIEYVLEERQAESKRGSEPDSPNWIRQRLCP